MLDINELLEQELPAQKPHSEMFRFPQPQSNIPWEQLLGHGSKFRNISLKTTRREIQELPYLILGCLQLLLHSPRGSLEANRATWPCGDLEEI